MTLSNIVNITISRETTVVSQAGFGVPLIVGSNGGFSGIRSYTDILGVAEDFATSDREYTLAAALFSQTNKPTTIKIGKLGSYVAGVYTLTYAGTLSSGSLVTVINDQTVTTAFTSDEGTTIAAHATALEDLDDVVSANVAGLEITITLAEGFPASILSTDQGDLDSGTVATSTAAVTNQGLLSDLSEGDDDWYVLFLADITAKHVMEAAAWVETRTKLLALRVNEAGTIDGDSTTDLAYRLNAKNYDRTFYIYSGTASENPEAAWCGLNLPEDPGSINWAYKNLAGITADDLTPTQEAAAEAKKSNHYQTVAGVAITRFGWVASGEYIDIMRGIDWVAARMQERIYSKLVNSKKIPYTLAGIGVVENEIRAALQVGVDRSLFVQGSIVVTVPDINTISSADKGNRILPDVTWSAQLAGAINKVTVAGRVTL